MSLLDGLVAYYKYDENTGTLVADATGNGHDGMWNGTLGSQWTPGIINSGGNFNGSDNGVQATIANPLLDGSFSFAAWVYFNAFGDTDSLIKSDIGTDPFWAQLYVHDYAGVHHPRFILDDGAGHQSPTSLNTALSTNQWYHFLAVRDIALGQVILYLNGGFEGSGTDTSTTVPTYSNFYMGQNGGPTAQFSNVIMDEVAVYSQALSAAEASQLWNNGAGKQFPFYTTTNQDQLARARMQQITNQLQRGKGAIRNTTPHLQFGKGDIRKITSQTQLGHSKLQYLTTQTQTGKAQVFAITKKTQQGRAFIISAYDIYNNRRSGSYRKGNLYTRNPNEDYHV